MEATLDEIVTVVTTPPPRLLWLLWLLWLLFTKMAAGAENGREKRRKMLLGQKF